MAISYPLAAPVAMAKQATARFAIRNATAMTTSPFTGQQQVFAWPNQLWIADVELSALPATLGLELEGWIAALRGKLGTFTFGPRHASGPRGTTNGSGLTVSGAGQTGRTLTIAGMGAARTMLMGSYFQLGTGSSTRLHRVTEDATANGSGVATLSIEPALRASPANAAAVIVALPVGQWRLTTDDITIPVERGLVWRPPVLSLIEAL
jgi:hypothetical protein